MQIYRSFFRPQQKASIIPMKAALPFDLMWTISPNLDLRSLGCVSLVCKGVMQAIDAEWVNRAQALGYPGEIQNSKIAKLYCKSLHEVLRKIKKTAIANAVISNPHQRLDQRCIESLFEAMRMQQMNGLSREIEKISSDYDPLYYFLASRVKEVGVMYHMYQIRVYFEKVQGARFEVFTTFASMTTLIAQYDYHFNLSVLIRQSFLIDDEQARQILKPIPVGVLNSLQNYYPKGTGRLLGRFNVLYHALDCKNFVWTKVLMEKKVDFKNPSYKSSGKAIFPIEKALKTRNQEIISLFFEK